MKLGDKKSRFFHQKANFKQQKNRIKGLKDQNGTWKSDKLGIKRVVVNYLTSIFQFSSCTGNPDVVVIGALERKVTPKMNDELCRDFTLEQVKAALFQMHPSKSPGSDGMSPLFFFLQKYWPIMGLILPMLFLYQSKSNPAKCASCALLAYVMYLTRLFPRSLLID